MVARILVVDDIEANVRLLEAKLTAEYYEVLMASDGPTALAMAAAESPDIILLDVMMPGMDGFEAYISKPISVSHFLETIRKFLG